MVGTPTCPQPRVKDHNMSATASASIEASVKDHISLILAGKALEGLEKYYAEDAVMQENGQPVLS
jgi:hypothetical protein